jgi:hypothetical protein
MTNTLFLASVFVISACAGFVCLFHAYRVQAVMVRICSKDKFAGFVMAKLIVESPYYIQTLRLAGAVAWFIAAVSYVALMSRSR